METRHEAADSVISDESDEDDVDYTLPFNYRSSNSDDEYSSVDREADVDANFRGEISYWNCKNCTRRNTRDQIFCRDVHHGNGTQDIFQADPSVLYISLHRYDVSYFYPQSGSIHEVGFGLGEGFIVNIPWNFLGVGDGDYINAFLHVVLPIARQFSPDLVIISAGFDAAIGDPLGSCRVTPAGFAQMTHLLTSVSEGRLLVILEGGYNLRSVSASGAAVLKVLLGRSPMSLPQDARPTQAGKKTIREVIAVQSRYWTSLKSKLSRTKNKARDVRKAVARREPIWWKWDRRKLVYAHWFKLKVASECIMNI